ncbi:7SK snRNA methylphosphate capping enzyme bin3 [Anopheles cruzii]|uniref:7SK snRNA methylphosphate capping enzyme bin3 n=1 Tax=Anopheles cruzii TaxID=68878 RepID=UPI0022EC8111|nr:7SK snRNA methylphosphate capping enzyme bin3 [Anopheles cruzii]
MEGSSSTLASADDESTADGAKGGRGGNLAATVKDETAGALHRGEETRRCNAHRAARPAMGRSQKGSTLATLTLAVGFAGGSGHGRQKKQQQRQQQQQLPPQHTGGKKQKKQQKWKANKYRGRGGGGKDGPAQGRKDAVGPPEPMGSNGTVAEDPGVAKQTGDNSFHKKTAAELGLFQQQQQQQHQNPYSSQAGQQLQHSTSQVQTVPSSVASQGYPGQELTKASSSQQQQPQQQQQQQKGKHSKQQNLSPMGLRNKRLQSVSKYFLPDKRPRKDCIVPPTKFLLGGNISDPLNLNSLQNESENAVTPKSSPIPTPPHYKAKIEVIIPPNINDPLHLLDPVDSVEYEMQLCSPMKRKQRPRNKRKRKSRTAAEQRNVTGDGSLLVIDQLPPPGAELASATGASASGAGGSTGTGSSGGGGEVEATTAEEASFTGIGQKFAEVTSASCPSSLQQQYHFLHQQTHQQSGGTHLLLTSSGTVATVGPNGGGAIVGGGGGGASGSSVGPVSGNLGPTGTTQSELTSEREREKAMRNLKLDLEAAGGRKRRTSESTNSTKNKVRRMDSMDKIVSPVIPQPGGWKRVHWPANAGGSGAAGGAGRNRTRTYSSASNADEQHCPPSALGEEPVPGATERREDGGAGQEHLRQQSDNRVEASVVSHSDETVATGGVIRPQSDAHSLEAQRSSVGDGTKQDLQSQSLPATEQEKMDISAPGAAISARSLTDLALSNRYHYGNYDRYYGYHSLNEFIDVRLKVFLRNPYLFRDKDVLDIGCNVGLMTIAVAKMLHTKSATGIDVDGKLIAKARKNLANYVRVPRKVSSGRRSATVTSGTLLLQAAEVKEQPKTHVTSGQKVEEAASEQQQQTSESTTTPVAPGTAPLPDGAASHLLDGAAAASDIDTLPIATAVDCGSATAEPQDNGARRQPQEHVDQREGSPEPQEHKQSYKQRLAQRLQRLKQKRRRKQFSARPGRALRHGHHGGHCGGRGKGADHSQYFPISFPLTMGNLSGKEHQMDIGRPEHKFPHNVRFKMMNYVVKEESLINYDTQQYDLILCLSVTKWIHLNYGDAGLKIAFKRMFNHLRPGGKLILEAQNWASYKKKKKLTETIFENYKNIEFFPCRFHDYLLSPEVGFSHSYPLGIPRHLSKGFRRPIQLYIKGDFTPSQAKWSDTYHPGTPYENHRGIYTDIVTGSQTAANCIWGAMTPYAPSYSYRQPPTPSHGGSGGGSGGGGNGFAATSPYYNPRQTDSYLPSYDNYGNGYRAGSYCFASPLYSTTWSPPSDMLATSGGGGGSYRRSASNTPTSGSIRSTDNDEHYYAGTAGGSQRRHHVYPPIDVFQPLLGQEHMRSGSGFRGNGAGAMTDSDSELSSNSASQTPTRQQQLAGSFLLDDQSNSPSGHSQPDK